VNTFRTLSSIAVVAASLLSAELLLGIPFVAAGTALVVIVIVAMMKAPRLWISGTLLILPVFLTESGEGLSPVEIALGGALILSITLWVLWRLANDYRSIIRTWTDAALFVWLALSSLNVAIAAANDINVADWFAEWAIFTLMLYYLPIREHFGSSESGRIQLLTVAAWSSILQALYSMWIFRQRMSSNLVYAFQLESARSVLLGPFFVLAIIGGIIAMFSLSSRKAKLLSGITILINAAALLLTFTRTLWVLGSVSVLITLLFLRWKQIVGFVTATTATITAAVAAAFTVAPNIANIALMLGRRRILSSTRLRGGDYSFETRMLEANAAWKQIAESPIGGKGIRSKILAWDPIYQMSNSSSFVHIGYLNITMKLGFPLALLFLGILTTFMIRGILDTLRVQKLGATYPSLRIMAVTLIAYIPTLYGVIFMSGVFDQRWGMFLLADLFALSAVVNAAVARPATITPPPVMVSSPATQS
jgi:O-antigen ligase